MCGMCRSKVRTYPEKCKTFSEIGIICKVAESVPGFGSGCTLMRQCNSLEADLSDLCRHLLGPPMTIKILITWHKLSALTLETSTWKEYYEPF